MIFRSFSLSCHLVLDVCWLLIQTLGLVLSRYQFGGFVASKLEGITCGYNPLFVCIVLSMHVDRKHINASAL
jgi:hypothetical protein